MQKIDLYTGDRIFIRSCDISPFDFPPEVVLWRKRVFKFVASTSGRWLYHEAFAVTLQDKSNITVLRPIDAT